MRLLVTLTILVAGFVQSSQAANWPPTIAAIGDSQTSTASASFLKHLPAGWSYIDLALVGQTAPLTLANSFIPALNNGTLAMADAFVIMHGTNDVVFGYEFGAPTNTGPSDRFNAQYYPAITQMVTGAQSLGIPVIIVAPPSVHPNWMPPAPNPDTGYPGWTPWVESAEVHQARITLAAQTLKELAEQYGAGFVDGDAIFAAAGYPASYFHTDFLHFSAAGHWALAEAINPALEALLAPVPLPATLPLLLTTFGVFAYILRRKRAPLPIR
jgi:lysophospholipase L1-like esterase